MRIFDYLFQYCDRHPGKTLYQYKKEGKWHDITVNQFLTDAQNLSKALYAKGIRKDDKVAIVSANRPEWNLVDFACQLLGAVSVPIYITLTEEDIAYIFQDAGVKMAFASTEDLARKCERSGVSVPGFSLVFTFDDTSDFPHFQSLYSLSDQVSDETLQESMKSIGQEDLLTLIYTSGTTGRPKGVMLTHNNLSSNIQACIPCFPLTHESKSLSFLPLCHIYERMLSYLYISLNITVAYAESMDTIGENLKEIHPNLFCTVPRLLEKVYDKIVAKGQELTGIKRALFFWALNLGLKYEINNDLGWWYNFQLKLANKIIFNKWREALGGNVKFIVSGGAALQPRLARVFSAAQIVVMEGYGLTETSPVISVNRYEESNRRIGMVGPVITGIEVKIAPDGEILTRGPHVMKGYYNKPDLTAEVIDAEGWFHTGDIGEFQEGKFLKITDRKKEMFKTSGGKYIAPQLIENKLKESLVIEQAMVIGDGEKFPAALLVPSFDGLKDWCRIKEIPYSDNETMLQHPKVVEKFNREVEKANSTLAQYEKIKKVKVVPGPWTIDGGEMTPTLKLKRKNLMQKYKAEVEGIYREE
jgi:long-chain acyl-CoA synthetase